MYKKSIHIITSKAQTTSKDSVVIAIEMITSLAVNEIVSPGF
jgi:hypothetical protein